MFTVRSKGAIYRDSASKNPENCQKPQKSLNNAENVETRSFFNIFRTTVPGVLLYMAYFACSFYHRKRGRIFIKNTRF